MIIIYVAEVLSLPMSTATHPTPEFSFGWEGNGTEIITDVLLQHSRALFSGISQIRDSSPST